MSKEAENKVINKWFLRQWLHVLIDQVDWKMKPTFIYYSNFSFDQDKGFKFIDNDLLDGVPFRKKKDYYYSVATLSCYAYVIKLPHCDKNSEISGNFRFSECNFSWWCRFWLQKDAI